MTFWVFIGASVASLLVTAVLLYWLHHTRTEHTWVGNYRQLRRRKRAGVVRAGTTEDTTKVVRPKDQP